MNQIFADYLRDFIIVFFENILIYSPSLELHVCHIDVTLQILKANKFFVKSFKCAFATPKVEYLGHIVSDGQLLADPAKLAAMSEWPAPKSVWQLRGFLGLTGYYRKFIRNYAILAAPLTALLSKDKFKWTELATDAFSKGRQPRRP